MSKLLMAITDRLPMRIINDGNRPYLERYYLFSLLGWTFYIHRFVGSDPERGLHDHPWRKAYSIILSGWYWEQTRMGIRRVSWFNSLTGDSFHRVILPGKGWLQISLDDKKKLQCDREKIPCWTLFFHTTKNVKPWGFLTPHIAHFQEGILIYEPYRYTREGNQKEWWLTAKSRKEMRK